MVSHQGVPTYTQRDPAGSSGLGCSTDVQKPAELKCLLLRALTCPTPLHQVPQTRQARKLSTCSLLTRTVTVAPQPLVEALAGSSQITPSLPGPGRTHPWMGLGHWGQRDKSAGPL